MAMLTSGNGTSIPVEVKWDQNHQTATAIVPHFSRLSFGWGRPSLVKESIQTLIDTNLFAESPSPGCVGKSVDVQGTEHHVLYEAGISESDDTMAWACASTDGADVSIELTNNSAMAFPIRTNGP